MIRVMVLRLLDFKIGQRTAIRAGFAFSGNRKLLKIGENTNINFNSCFDLMDQINIGNYCQIGPNVSFITSSHTLPSDFISRRPDVSLGPLIVEDFVFMGANVTILGGITVGKGSVIAAGSLVNKTVPQNSLVGGVPARVIKEL
jgi:maltose O-acetyltransferase